MLRLEIVAVRTSAPYLDELICYEGMILDEGHMRYSSRKQYDGDQSKPLLI